MIDTDKYEGHTEGSWVYNRLNSKGQYNLIAPDDWAIDIMAYDSITAEDIGMKEQDMSLIADAPLLLAEVKRLYALISHVAHKLEYYFDDDADSYLGLNLLETMYYGDDEE